MYIHVPLFAKRIHNKESYVHNGNVHITLSYHGASIFHIVCLNHENIIFTLLSTNQIDTSINIQRNYNSKADVWNFVLHQGFSKSLVTLLDTHLKDTNIEIHTCTDMYMCAVSGASIKCLLLDPHDGAFKRLYNCLDKPAWRHPNGTNSGWRVCAVRPQTADHLLFYLPSFAVISGINRWT